MCWIVLKCFLLRAEVRRGRLMSLATQAWDSEPRAHPEPRDPAVSRKTQHLLPLCCVLELVNRSTFPARPRIVPSAEDGHPSLGTPGCWLLPKKV